MKKQFGRSMIEMLGVLAIIGVLSIGGIVLYRRAVNNHQANVILDDVNRFAFTIVERSPLPDGEISKSDFVQSSQYTITATNDLEENYFYIDVAGVPKGVCKEVLNKKSNDFEIYAGEQGNYPYQGDDGICDGTNLITFLFDTEEDFCREDSDCGHCSQCVENHCQYGFTDRSEENCYDCDDESVSIYDIKEEECHRCKNRMYSYYSSDTTEGRCVVPLTHDMNYWSAVSEEECKRFPNQYWVGSKCFYCEGSYDPSTGVCNTTDCHRNGLATTIYGLSENDCIGCGGDFRMISSGGKKIGRCTKDTHWD